MDSITRPAIVLLSIAALWTNKANDCAKVESWNIRWKTPQVDQKKFDCPELSFNVDPDHFGLQASIIFIFTNNAED